MSIRQFTSVLTIGYLKVFSLNLKLREGTILSGEYDRDYKEYSEKVIALQAEQAKLKEQNFEVQLTRQRLMEITEVLVGK